MFPKGFFKQVPCYIRIKCSCANINLPKYVLTEILQMYAVHKVPQVKPQCKGIQGSKVRAFTV